MSQCDNAPMSQRGTSWFIGTLGNWLISFDIIAQIFLCGASSWTSGENFKGRQNFQSRLTIHLFQDILANEMNNSSALSCDTIVVISKGQLSSDLGGQQVILNPQSGIYYGLDAVGAFIWRALQTPCRISEIRDALMARYHINTARAERDLIALLTDMRESGLIEIHDEPAI